MTTNQKKEPKQVVQLRQKIEDLTQALQVERADAVNVRRRAEEDRIKMASYYKAEVIKNFIPFIDNIELTMKHVPKEIKDPNLKTWMDGLSNVYTQLWKILNDIGVKKIETLGKEFDPKLHDAVQMDGGQGSKEVIVEEFRSGYLLENEVIRHAMVKVAMN